METAGLDSIVAYEFRCPDPKTRVHRLEEAVGAGGADTTCEAVNEALTKL